MFGVNLFLTNLSDAKLSWANLCEASLSMAILIGADLSGANLSGAYLIEADLSRAVLYGANLKEANLYRAKLNNVIWKSYPPIVECANFENAEINDKEFVEYLRKNGAINVPDPVED